MTTSDKRAELLKEIADGVDRGSDSPLTPLLHKAVRLAAMLEMTPYEMLFQTHLDGPRKKTQSDDESVRSGSSEADFAPYEPKVRADMVADREWRGKVIGAPLEILEELHRQAAQDRADLVPDTRARELDLRMVISRIRNRLGRFVIHAERELATAVLLETQAQSALEVKTMSIQADALLVLRMLAEFEQEPGDAKRGRYNLTQDGVAATLKDKWDADLSPERLNEAVQILEDNGYVNVRRGPGTTPYRFSGVEVTASGRLQYEQQMEKVRAAAAAVPPIGTPPKLGTKIFLGHGRSHAWRQLKDLIQDRLKLSWDEFDREPNAGFTTKERLEKMLAEASFAFLVMTAEDETVEGRKTARANVIHEVGLFQGRLGFNRAIVLLEEGCDEFSNIAGLTQIHFPKDNIGAKSEEIRRVLERERVLPKTE